ncbi:MAG: hypothetical protein ISN28_16235 [Ectothiorhodospiraceae bacterium AqS1]|nr:hypothetical protein [Ectothiorhodospiraceae bacterium AqS1]MBF2761783.1 hypothetical protein [Ectothiorhodospiraceae bacterium AqS1]
MIGLNDVETIVAIVLGAVALLGVGSAVTWWATRRFENLIDNKVNHMDRLQSIENRVTQVEARMATKDDLAEMAARLSAQSKQDMAEMESRLSAQSKSDMAEMESRLSAQSKHDMAEMESRLSAQSKNDMATLKTELLEAIKNMNGNGHR